jgi:hypothetical protein
VLHGWKSGAGRVVQPTPASHTPRVHCPAPAHIQSRGVFTQAPPVQLSAVQAMPSSQLRGMYLQVPPLQLSIVQKFPSSQLRGMPTHAPVDVHRSFSVQPSPSLHTAPARGVDRQPIIGSQASTVHGLPSSGQTRGRRTHVVPSQLAVSHVVSAQVAGEQLGYWQPAAALQVPPGAAVHSEWLGVNTQPPAPQVSTVHAIPSLQGAPAWQTPPLHRSSVVQGSPSEHVAAFGT